MATHTKSRAKTKTTRAAEAGWYKGKQAKTGNSLGLRFDKALFQSHPEFNGMVQACVIAPGRMLVVAQPLSKAGHDEDPVIASFLSFLAKDMAQAPHRVTPLDEALVERINRLVGNIETDPAEDLGDKALI